MLSCATSNILPELPVSAGIDGQDLSYPGQGDTIVCWKGLSLSSTLCLSQRSSVHVLLVGATVHGIAKLQPWYLQKGALGES